MHPLCDIVTEKPASPGYNKATNKEKEDTKMSAMHITNENFAAEVLNSEKPVLLDFYAELLDEHIRSVMRAYYEDDLSLSEVAEDVGISRQGVRHLIKKGEEQLEFFESKLGLAQRDEELTLICESLKSISARLAASETFSADSKELLNISEAIMKGNQDVRESN